MRETQKSSPSPPKPAAAAPSFAAAVAVALVWPSHSRLALELHDDGRHVVAADAVRLARVTRQAVVQQLRERDATPPSH